MAKLDQEYAAKRVYDEEDMSFVKVLKDVNKKVSASNFLLIDPVVNVFCPTGKGGGVDPTCGSGGKGVGRVNVVTETSLEDADVLVSQGLRPDFKRKRNVDVYSPGAGLEREGTYVAEEGAFSKGSFGNVRVHLEVDKQELDVPQELKQLGYSKDSLDFALKNEQGAITTKELPPSRVKSVEIYDHASGKWSSMSSEEYKKKRQIEGIPRLPSMQEYESQLRKNSEEWFLDESRIQDLLTGYNRAPLTVKLDLSKEAELIQ